MPALEQWDRGKFGFTLFPLLLLQFSFAQLTSALEIWAASLGVSHNPRTIACITAHNYDVTIQAVKYLGRYLSVVCRLDPIVNSNSG